MCGAIVLRAALGASHRSAVQSCSASNTITVAGLVRNSVCSVTLLQLTKHYCNAQKAVAIEIIQLVNEPIKNHMGV
jgi:hypothetical protein